MTPASQHQEQAGVMARGCALYLQKCLPTLSVYDAERIIISKLNLPQLLADQAECERLRKEIGGLQQQRSEWHSDNTKLRAELKKWKFGCETNSDCYKAAITAQDEQRLELIKLRTQNTALLAVMRAAEQFTMTEGSTVEHTLANIKLREALTAATQSGVKLDGV